MKMLAIVSFVLLFVRAAQAQEVMKLEMIDGTELLIPVNDIVSLKYTVLEEPTYRAIDLHTYPPRFDKRYYPASFDSMRFGKDDAGYTTLISINPYAQDEIRIVGPKPDTSLFIWPLDSITFTQYVHNAKVTKIPSEYEDPTTPGPDLGYYRNSAWSGDDLFVSQPQRWIGLDQQHRVVADSTVSFKRALDIHINSKRDRMLIVETRYNDVSLGTLFEVDLNTGKSTRLVLDSMISSARYIGPGNDVMYYSYGSYDQFSMPMPSDAGYFRIMSGSNAPELLARYISDFGPNEGVNAFDVTNDGKTLLLGMASSSSAASIALVNLESGIRDTLLVSFDLPCLYVEYSPDEGKILYSNYPPGVFYDGLVLEGSEVGIVDLSSRSKKIINCAPDNEFTWMSVFPHWNETGELLSIANGIVSDHLQTIVGYDIYVVDAKP